MELLTWDDATKRLFEVGVSKGVLYPWDKTANAGKGGYGVGVAWNGLSGVSETPSGAEASPVYADNIKYLNLFSNEEFGATIEAYTYPDEFAACDGSAEVADGVMAGQQTRSMFGFSFQSLVGNDTDDTEHGYKIHLIYGCKASPSERAFTTVNDSPEAMTFSWEVSTTPVKVNGFKPTSILTIDSTKVPADKLKDLEAILYGTAAEGSTQAIPARLPLPDEVISIIGKTQG